MTDHVVRLYAFALALLVFLVTWAVIAARPWAPAAEAANDPRVAQLEKRERRLARRQVEVQRLVERRFAAYRRRLADRRRQAALTPAGGSPPTAAAAPSVQVTSLPPVTETSSS
jgi:hypothetical protein